MYIFKKRGEVSTGFVQVTRVSSRPISLGQLSDRFLLRFKSIIDPGRPDLKSTLGLDFKTMN